MRDVQEWADFMTLPLNGIGVLPQRLNHPSEWKEWAFHLIQEPRLQQMSVPDPRVFDSWIEWAERFNEAVAS